MSLVLRWTAQSTYGIRTDGLEVTMSGWIRAQADEIQSGRRLPMEHVADASGLPFADHEFLPIAHRY